MRTPSAKAKSSQGLQCLITTTKRLWRQYYLTYDQARYMAKEVRCALTLENGLSNESGWSLDSPGTRSADSLPMRIACKA
jgi:hypothetical protein